MIINLRFGYRTRHQIYYDTERKRGTLTLWSSYSGPATDTGAIQNREVPSLELIVHPGALTETLFGGNQQTEFALAEEPDLFAMLASLVAVINGAESSFTSKEGRKITLSLKKETKSKKDMITVGIQYGKEAKLTMGEAHKLHTIAMDILRDLGYSDQDISKRLKSIAEGLPN